MGMKKILIADDDTQVHDLLTRTLDCEEYEIIHAYDGVEAMKSITKNLPDLVILDIVMPGKDGRDICREIKQNQAMRDIKILMLTSKDQQFERRIGVELGADDYEVKPFSPSYIGTKIKRMLSS